MPKKGWSPYVHVWAHDDTTERFFPISGPLPVAGARYFRTGLDVFQHTGDATIRPAIQVSNDAEDWPSATSFTRVGTHTATADGISHGSGADVDLTSSLQYRYFREGVTVQGTGGTPKIEHAMVAISFMKRPA